MAKYSKFFYLFGFLMMPIFIILLVFGYVKLNQMAGEQIYWGHTRSFAFSQASREGKLILLSFTKSRCDALYGKYCGEGKLDLGDFVLLNLTPSDQDFADMLLDDRFSALKSNNFPMYYLLNTNGEIRFSGSDFPTPEDLIKLGKE